MSLSCRPALLCRPPWPDNELLRGVKNLLNRLGVTVGGFFGLSVLERNEAAASLRDFNGDEGRMSWSTRMVERHSDWLSWEEGKGSSAMVGMIEASRCIKETTTCGEEEASMHSEDPVPLVLVKLGRGQMRPESGPDGVACGRGDRRRCLWSGCHRSRVASRSG